MSAEHTQPDGIPATCLVPADTKNNAPARSGYRKPVWRPGFLALAILAVLISLLTLLYYQARSQAIADIKNLNGVLEARLNSVLTDAQTSLQSIAVRMNDELMARGASHTVEPWLSRGLRRHFPLIGHFDVLANDGKLLFDSDASSDVPTDGEPHLRDILAQSVALGVTTSTVAIDHDAAHRLIYMAVPIFHGPHQVGWIVTRLSLQPILDAIAQVDVGMHGVITLRRTDIPAAVLRVPPPPLDVSSYSADAIDELLAEGAQQGSVVSNSRVDGVKRLYGFKRVGNYPLALVTGLAVEDYLRSWQYTAVAAFMFSAVMYFLILTLTLRLQTNRVHREQIVDELRHSAFHDELTGLPNRRYLLRRVSEAIKNCGRGQKMSLFYFDLDNFKTINDSLGHVAGDQVLQRLAQRLIALKPSVDTVARLSGDEFLVLVESDDAKWLSQLVQKIIEVLNQPMDLQGQALSITASAGVACYGDHGLDFGALLKAADMAMAQAKRNGRNTWAFYEPEMGEREMRLHYLQTELRQALARQELQIHYQPQIDLRSGKVVGAEALLRWTHAKEGPIAPSEFIPVAEATGLIMPISQWVLDEVCHQAVSWQAAGFGELSVAMNCSALQFRQGDLVKDVRNALYNSGLDAHLLELELTESILIEQSERAMDTVRGLKALGVRMSIDDFGTGYSSMSYLKRFAVDRLKIDQSFVQGMLNNHQDAAIVQAVIMLGHRFGMKVIAEGIEQQAAHDAVILGGCDEAQGYYYARALRPADFELFMDGRIESSYMAEKWV